KRLYKKLKDYKLNYLHQVSNQIIKLAIDKKVKTIVVGDMKFIKQNMNYNKTFVKAPILKLKELIKYKANLHAINYSEQNESYTSGCSALDLEEVNKANYNKNRRIKRGLFKSNENILINSDVNGSLNILRKFLKTKCIPKLIIVVRDNGYVNYPKRIRVA
ncbi:IS200/IS605 family accessory protein TnpB-related protein, partial [Clostridiaceae bacterium HSG29]|nr:IS200/IS605 family accessory protein TnpB-related protein [Clostridiaceae bacterium HSG29]